ncbi:hypothetical protein ACFP1Z_07745 [Streptomyces gamaensis]|uniref:Class F sortase n=1 Tax=Streptomyces gamaensis TaxID=1763542 RepID=A0ABW0Z123_9ACTN
MRRRARQRRASAYREHAATGLGALTAALIVAAVCAAVWLAVTSVPAHR